MSTDLEQRLRDELREDAQRARLVNADGPRVSEVGQLPVGEPSRWTTRRLVAAAAIVLLVAATVAVVQSRRPVREERPAGLEVFNELTLGDGALYTEVSPGTKVDLPAAPISQRAGAAVVWTGHELVVWGGRDAQDVERFGDGAAFDPATGTWRTLAPAPIVARDAAASVWTGTELFIWGGYDRRGAFPPLTDGAAYDPATDTWRRVADAPIEALHGGWQAVWTGEEVVAFVDEGMAAYDPDEDEWRELGDRPADTGPVSSGKTFLALRSTGSNRGPTYDPERATVDLLRYDLSRDAWVPVREAQQTDTIIDITGADGLTRGVLIASSASAEDVTALDPAGEVLGTFPPFPAGSFSFYGATWAGQEVLFAVFVEHPNRGGIEYWALDVGTESWRQLAFGEQPPEAAMMLAPELGVLFGVREPSERVDGPFHAFLYRPPTPPGIATGTVGQPQDTDPTALPAPGEPPADPAAAEQQVRTAFTTIFDATRPPEERAPFSERPATWLDASQQLRSGQFADMVKDVQAEVDGVVFTAPTRAVVRFRLVASADLVPADMQLGEALLVDGRWVVAIRTTCDVVSAANVSCDLAL